VQRRVRERPGPAASRTFCDAQLHRHQGRRHGERESRALGNYRHGIFVEAATSNIQIVLNISSDNGWRNDPVNPVGYGIDLGGSGCTIAWNIFGLDINLGVLPNKSVGSLDFSVGGGNTWEENLEQ
jgi:hypothetical protein